MKSHTLGVLFLPLLTLGCVDQAAEEVTLESETSEVREPTCRDAVPQDNISVAIPFGSKSKTSPSGYDNDLCDEAWVVVVSGAPLNRFAEATVEVKFQKALPANQADCLATSLLVDAYGTFADGTPGSNLSNVSGQWTGTRCELSYNRSSFTVGTGGFVNNKLRLNKLAIRGKSRDQVRIVTAKVTAGPSL